VARLVAEVNVRRAAAGLQPVVPDTGRWETLARILPKHIEAEAGDFFDGSFGLQRVERLVTDWEKQCYVVEAESEDLLLTELDASYGFAEAVLEPDASHVAAAVGRIPDGGAWCAVCVIQKLLSIGGSHGKVSPGFSGSSGSATLTFTGLSGYPDVLVEYYEEPTAAVETDTTVFSALADVDESGAFSVTLRFGYPGCPGAGTYEIVMYVRESERDEYRPANRTRYVFGGS
jgi:hypothetical protein